MQNIICKNVWDPRRDLNESALTNPVGRGETRVEIVLPCGFLSIHWEGKKGFRKFELSVQKLAWPPQGESEEWGR